jgi:hypothetical protein
MHVCYTKGGSHVEKSGIIPNGVKATTDMRVLVTIAPPI